MKELELIKDLLDKGISPEAINKLLIPEVNPVKKESPVEAESPVEVDPIIEATPKLNEESAIPEWFEYEGDQCAYFVANEDDKYDCVHEGDLLLLTYGGGDYYIVKGGDHKSGLSVEFSYVTQCMSLLPIVEAEELNTSKRLVCIRDVDSIKSGQICKVHAIHRKGAINLKVSRHFVEISLNNFKNKFVVLP